MDRDTHLIWESLRDQIELAKQAGDEFKNLIHSIYNDPDKAEAFINYINSNINYNRNPDSIESWVNRWNGKRFAGEEWQIDTENRVPVINAIQKYQNAAYYRG